MINENASKVELRGSYGVFATFNVVDLSPYFDNEDEFDSRTSLFQPRENNPDPASSILNPLSKLLGHKHHPWGHHITTHRDKSPPSITNISDSCHNFIYMPIVSLPDNSSRGLYLCILIIQVLRNSIVSVLNKVSLCFLSGFDLVFHLLMEFAFYMEIRVWMCKQALTLLYTQVPVHSLWWKK